jgi:neutral amino acid transport system ATP-binding protein
MIPSYRRPVSQVILGTKLPGQVSVTLLVVEQNVMQALKHADRAYVISSGVIRHEGKAEELRSDPKLIESYLGS